MIGFKIGEEFYVIFFGYLCKNWKRREHSEKQACEGNGLLNRILQGTGIYSFLMYEWIHLKESNIKYSLYHQLSKNFIILNFKIPASIFNFVSGKFMPFLTHQLSAFHKTF